MSPAPRLWHGGAPGRRVGDLLLPPSVTGIPSRLHRESVEKQLGPVRQREDLVYVTSDRELARACAGVWSPDGVSIGGGSLYQVRSDEPLVEDEDLPGLGLSFQVPSAVVVAVVDAYVARDDRRHGRTLREVLSRLP